MNQAEEAQKELNIAAIQLARWAKQGVPDGEVDELEGLEELLLELCQAVDRMDALAEQ